MKYFFSCSFICCSCCSFTYFSCWFCFEYCQCSGCCCDWLLGSIIVINGDINSNCTSDSGSIPSSKKVK